MNFIRALLLFFRIIIISVTGYVGYLIIGFLINAYQAGHLMAVFWGLVSLSAFLTVIFILAKTEKDLRI